MSSQEMEEDKDQKPQILEQLESDTAFVQKLHPDLLAAILFCLPVVDYVRSGAVCRSWRRATAGKPRNSNPPLLMFPGADKGSDDPDSFIFFSIAHHNYYSIHLPEIRGKHCAGSSHSSIVATCPTEILLLDLLTGTQVRLPPVTHFCDFTGEFEHPLVEKLVFSSSSSTAVAIYTRTHPQLHCLSFARVGDSEWTALREEEFSHFGDVIIHGREFYAVDHCGLLLSFDPADSGYVTIHGYAASFTNVFDRVFLVESLDGDHLLLVCRIMNVDSWMTDSFEIFKQDKVGRQWVEVRSLGEVAVFVGNNSSICVFTRGLPKPRGNCVYFTDDGSLAPTRDDFGVFDLGDGSIKEVVARPQICDSWPPPFWIMPNSCETIY